MKLHERILYWLGLIEKEYHHIVGPAKTMMTELEDLADRKSAEIVKAAEQIKFHEEVISLASRTQGEAIATAAAVRSFFSKIEDAVKKAA